VALTVRRPELVKLLKDAGAKMLMHPTRGAGGVRSATAVSRCRAVREVGEQRAILVLGGIRDSIRNPVGARRIGLMGRATSDHSSG